MSRIGRWVVVAVGCLLAAVPAARAGVPTPTVKVYERSSPAGPLGGETRNLLTGEVFIGDPGPERGPRLITFAAEELTVTLDAPADSLEAWLGDVSAPVTQTGERAYTVRAPAGLTLPAFLRLAITSTDGDWRTRAGWGLELAKSPSPTFATALTPAVRPALLSATEGSRNGGPTLIADGFGLNSPTLRVSPGGTVTVALTGWVNTLTARVGGVPLTAVKVDDATYTVALPANPTLPAKFSVGIDYSSETFLGSAGFTADLAAPTVLEPSQPTPVDGRATLSALRLSGRKVSVTVACSGTCPGIVTLRTSSIRIARLSFAGPGRYTATISRPAQRHLQRHRTKRLRAVLTTRGFAPRALTLRVR